MTQAQGGEEFLATFANVHTHSQAYAHAIFLLISPLERTCNVSGRGAAKCFLYRLTHFPVAFVLLRKGKMNLGEQLAISVPGIVSRLPSRCL